MKQHPLLFILTLMAHISFGQNIRASSIVDDKSIFPPPDTSKVYFITDQMPSFPGGDHAYYTFIRDHLIYPDEERKNNIQGRVIVHFIVERDGSLSQISITQKVGPGIDTEALRLVNMLPEFIPGRQKGITVRVEYVVPVNFRL